jgi:acetolactate synthase-1/2/3 large subunit
VYEADLVLFVGSHTGSQVTNSFSIPKPGTQVIQIDIDGAEMGRSYPNGVSVLGDAKMTLQAMLAEGTRGERHAWLARVHELVADWRRDFEPLLTSDAVPMRPERVCHEIQKALPEDAMVVSDTGHSGIWSGTMIELTKPHQRYLRAAGSLGWGFPAALGAKCALPDTPVVCFTGDGGFYYHLSELETAVRFGLNIVVVINDNVSLNQELAWFDPLYNGKQTEGGLKMWTFEKVNFAAVAESMGVLGMRVERPADLPDALSQALKANRPVVIDAATDIQALGPLAWQPTS